MVGCAAAEVGLGSISLPSSLEEVGEGVPGSDGPGASLLQTADEAASFGGLGFGLALLALLALVIVLGRQQRVRRRPDTAVVEVTVQLLIQLVVVLRTGIVVRVGWA